MERRDDTHPWEGEPTQGSGRRFQRRSRPTVRQIYALAAALCERAGEEFPETFEAASELIERLRLDSGHPAPRLEDTPTRPVHRGRGRKTIVIHYGSRRQSELP